MILDPANAKCEHESGNWVNIFGLIIDNQIGEECEGTLSLKLESEKII